MPIAEYRCKKCGDVKEIIVDSPIPPFVHCDLCSTKEDIIVSERIMSSFGGYKINGNNSASITPKKFRGGR